MKYEQSAQMGNAKLLLNGAGMRYKAIFKVYTAGLYLGGKAATPEAVLAAPGPKRMHIVMLRDIDANELGKLFTRGMQDNAPREEFSKSIAGTLRMADLFSAKKKLAAGEYFSVDYVPGQGTTVLINGKAADRADQGTRVLLGAAEDLARPLAGRCPAEGSTAGQGRDRSRSLRELTARSRRSASRHK